MERALYLWIAETKNNAYTSLNVHSFTLHRQALEPRGRRLAEHFHSHVLGSRLTQPHAQLVCPYNKRGTPKYAESYLQILYYSDEARKELGPPAGPRIATFGKVRELI